MTGGGLPPEAFAAALAGLAGMGPARLYAVLQQWPPQEAWSRVSTGRALAAPEVAATCGRDGPALGPAWAKAARNTDVAAVWAAHVAAGVAVYVVGSPGYPALLGADVEPPAVLFSRGDFAGLDRRRVGIVGTRRCTRYGRDVAAELGRDLASQGVTVVSGLALGVDGAAHSGTLAAGESSANAGPPVAVVGSGLDVVYPRQHAGLWRQVGETGLLLTEAPLRARPEPWRFPVRNRVIAALSEVVVVVESHPTGGCHHTIEAAALRGVPVMAVPGSVRSSASTLPNALLADGCAPVRDALDVLVALGLSATGPARPVDTRPAPSGTAVAVLEAVGWEPATLEEIVLRAGVGPGPASTALAHLERDGWVASEAGWWERAG